MQKPVHDQRMFVFLSVAGLLMIFGIGAYNLYLGETMRGAIELIVGGIGVVNLIFFALTRQLTVATHLVAILIAILLGYLLVNGGIAGSGGYWIFVYPALTFSMLKWRVASVYSSLLGFGLAGITILVWLGYDVTNYNLRQLVQLILAYILTAVMWSIAERIHNRIENEYDVQGRQLEHERSILWQQRDQLRVFKTAVEQSGEMMLLADPEGIVLWANGATERVTGFTPAEAVGKKAGELWGHLMDQAYYAEMWETIKKRKELFTSEIQNHRKNGERFFSTITIYPLLSSAGEIQYMVATQRDITEQKEVDQMKTDFVSLVSHQLRTPLTALRWNLETLLAGELGKLSAKQKVVLREVQESNIRMIKLISTLLNISRIESGRLIVETNEVELRTYMQEAVKSCHSNERGQKIVLELPQEEVKVKVDTGILRHVIANLVSNASKYSPAEGEIKVTLEKGEQGYTIRVSDAGYGIPQAEQRKIFGKFFRASNVRKYSTDGTGMGLYIVSLLVKLLGGKIGFESREGVGSTFTVTLPLKGVPARAGEVRLV